MSNPSPAEMAEEFLKRVDLKGAEVPAFNIVSDWLQGQIMKDRMKAAPEAAPEVVQQIIPTEDDSNPKGQSKAKLEKTA